MFHMGLTEEISKHHKMFFKYMTFKYGRLIDIRCGDRVFLKEVRKIV